MNKNIISTQKLTRIGIIGAIYAAMTILLAPISYGQVQFRFSEILMMFAFIDPMYAWGLALGCAVANFYSPLGIVDIIFGTTATLISGLLMSKCKKLELSVIFPPLINGLVIGTELFIVYKLPLLLSVVYVFVGEFAVVLIGYFIFKILMKNKRFMQLIK